MTPLNQPDLEQDASPAGGHASRPRRALVPPVFVDESGRRHGGLRAAAWGAGTLVVGVGALLLLALLSGLLGEPRGGWGLLPPPWFETTPAPASNPTPAVGDSLAAVSLSRATSGASAPSATATAPAVTEPVPNLAPEDSTAPAVEEPIAAPTSSAAPAAPVPAPAAAPARSTAPAETEPVAAPSKPVGSAHGSRRATPTPGNLKK